MTPGEKLKGLSEGDTITGGALLGGISPAQIEATVAKVSNAGAVTIDLTLLGVKLVRVAGKVSDTGKISWMLGA